MSFSPTTTNTTPYLATTSLNTLPISIVQSQDNAADPEEEISGLEDGTVEEDHGFSTLTSEEQKDCFNIAQMWINIFINVDFSQKLLKLPIWGAYYKMIPPRNRVPLTSLSRMINEHIKNIIVKIRDEPTHASKAQAEDALTKHIVAKRKRKLKRLKMETGVERDNDDNDPNYSFSKRYFFIYATFVFPKRENLNTELFINLSKYLSPGVYLQNINAEELQKYAKEYKENLQLKQPIVKPSSVEVPFPQIRLENHQKFIRLIIALAGMDKDDLQINLSNNKIKIIATPTTLQKACSPKVQALQDDLVLRTWTREICIPFQLHKKVRPVKFEAGCAVVDFDIFETEYEEIRLDWPQNQQLQTPLQQLHIQPQHIQLQIHPQ